MFKTIRTKFILISVLFIILSAGIPIYILINQFGENFNQRSLRMLQSSADFLLYELYNSMMQGDKNIQSIVSSLSNFQHVNHIRIFNDEGILQYSSMTSEIGKRLPEIDPEHAKLKNLYDKSVRLIDTKNVYSITEPIVNEKRCQTCHGKTADAIAYLDVDTQLTEAEKMFFTGSSHMLFLGISVILILTFGLYIIFTYLINKPILSLNNALKSVEAGNFDIKLSNKRNDEIGNVYKRFNQMMEKLKSSMDKIEELHFEQLQRADRLTTLGELTSQVAHEVNNHTAVIMSRADFLDMEVSNQQRLDPYKDDFKTILNQTKKISVITKNLLRHSKQTPSNKEKIDIEKTISNSIQILQPLLKRKVVNCYFNSDIKTTYIFADELQIEQVITNLILNAADAVEKNGVIEISIKSSDNNGLIILVKDNGQGINPNDLDKIFSPFYSSKPEGKGTGLGLYIVKNICESHGIIIRCKSEIGKGTTFYLEVNEIFTMT